MISFKVFQKLIVAISQSKNAKKIARHLARISLYELKGADALYPELRDKYVLLEARMRELGKPIWLAEGFRTIKKQDRYYKKIPNFTNAKGLESYHQYGLAMDIAFKGYDWKPPFINWWYDLGREGKNLGLEWGGDWSEPDKPHFKLPTKFTWKDIFEYFKVDYY